LTATVLSDEGPIRLDWRVVAAVQEGNTVAAPSN